MKILTINNPEDVIALRSVSFPVENPEVYSDIFAKMKAYIENPENGAVGLAAVQIGMPIRAFVAKFPAQKGFRARR